MVIRLYGYTFDLMKQKRKQRAYKCEDLFYDEAKKKADKTGKPLATRIEEFVVKYSGVEKSSYFAAMGNDLMKESNKKKK